MKRETFEQSRARWDREAQERAAKAAATRATPEGRALLAGAPVVIKCGNCGEAGDFKSFLSPSGHQYTTCPNCGLCVQIDRICGRAIVTVVQAGRGAS